MFKISRFFCTPKKVILREEYKKLITIARPQRRKYFYNIMITVTHAGLSMYLPNIYHDLSYLMTLKTGINTSQQILNNYSLILGKWSLIFGATGALTYKRRFEFLEIENRISTRMRNVFYKNILNSQIYKKRTTGQAYIHHLVTDIKTVSQFMGETIFIGLRGCLFLIGGVSCLVFTSPYLSVGCVIIMSAFNQVFKSKNANLKALKSQQNQALKQLSEFSSQRINNIKLIKISNTKDYEIIGYQKQLGKLYHFSQLVAKANGLNYGLMEGLGLFSLFSVASFGSILISFDISQFNLLASSTYALYVALGFRSLMNFNTQMLKILGVYSTFEDKIGDLRTNQEYQEDFPIQKLEQKMKELESKVIANQKLYNSIDIKFENIKFKYKQESKSGLKNLNLIIKSGKFVAITGSSGIGKSTLLNLLTRLYQPESGQIYFNEQKLKEKSDQFIQQNISYVTQQSFVFSGSFYSNLVYGNQGFDLSEQNIVKALKIAQAYEFVMKKGGLYGQVKQKGSNLSGGQKQRLILARALIKKPRILILDEATANIDHQSQTQFYKSLKQFHGDSTCIIINHKLEQIQEYIDQKIEFESLNN